MLSWLQHASLAHLLLVGVDVLIVAVVIYRTLLLIRGTRAAYMLCGLLAVGGAYLLARQLHLATLSWLLDHLISYSLLIAIVVFQRDIRRALLRFGRRLVPARAPEDGQIIEALVGACEELAARRIGALIVIERAVDLGDVASAGTTLDAQISRELLRNLFTPLPDNPLHDGAVIIRGTRIAQAGALLPLSASAALGRDLGTRHRAGVGVTEESDAICLVVSEERGTVSLCNSGCLQRDLDSQWLRSALERLLFADARATAGRRLPCWLERAARELLIGERAAAGPPKAQRQQRVTCPRRATPAEGHR